MPICKSFKIPDTVKRLNPVRLTLRHIEWSVAKCNTIISNACGFQRCEICGAQALTFTFMHCISHFLLAFSEHFDVWLGRDYCLATEIVYPWFPSRGMHHEATTNNTFGDSFTIFFLAVVVVGVAVVPLCIRISAFSRKNNRRTDSGSRYVLVASGLHTSEWMSIPL